MTQGMARVLKPNWGRISFNKGIIQANFKIRLSKKMNFNARTKESGNERPRVRDNKSKQLEIVKNKG